MPHRRLGPWLLSLSLLPMASALAAPPERPVDPTDHTDRERMVARLLPQVAYIKVRPKGRRQDAFPGEAQDGFGVAIEPKRIVCLSFIVDRADRVEVTGPNGKKSQAKVLLMDVGRRVAVIEPELEAEKLGLQVVKSLPKEKRELDQPVFALSATVEPYLLDGVLTDLGLDPEVEGILLSDLRLAKGMPVFDDRGRFVGYSRAVEWDSNRLMLISPEIIQAARTATASATPNGPAPKSPSPEPPSGWIRGTRGGR